MSDVHGPIACCRIARVVYGASIEELSKVVGQIASTYSSFGVIAAGIAVMVQGDVDCGPGKQALGRSTPSVVPRTKGKGPCLTK